MMKKFAVVFGLLGAPAFAIDTCLIGVWEADGADMAHVLGVQMNGTATHISGQTLLEINEFGNMQLLADDMKYEIVVPNIPPMEVTVNGYSQGSMDTDTDGPGNYIANATEFDLLATALVLGERMEIPVTSASGAGWGTSRGIYGCTDASVSFEADDLGSIPRRLFRR